MSWVLIIVSATFITTQAEFPSWDKCYAALQKTPVSKSTNRIAYCQRVKQ